MQSYDLLVTLVIALLAAMIGAVVLVRLRQSVILGYLLAGVAISPFTPGLVGDVDMVRALADIGVVLLMFAIGVQLSFRDMLRVGRVSVIAGVLQVPVMIAIGYGVGIALDWPPLQAFCFGAVISNSSSTVLTKILGERGENDAEHGRIALVWSSVQDLGTVVLVVVLTALAVDENNLVESLAWAMGRALLFVGLLAPLGTFVLPWVFERVASLRSREIFVVAVAVVALGAAYLSLYFGLSLALGAFVAGIVISEADLSHQVLGEVTPLRDIFAGLFFVSIGMLVNPAFVVGNLGNVALAIALIVVVKGVLSALLAGLLGTPPRTAVLTGVTLAQCAEFSFLLAGVGLTLGVVSREAFSLMLAAAAVSIALSPSLHALAQRPAQWLETRLAAMEFASHSAPYASREGRPRGHAVICGYGRVGRLVGEALERRGFTYLIIDVDPRVVRRLREQGKHALLGNAANPILLQQVGLERARSLILAFPDPLAARQVVDYAQRVNGRLDIVVRTHSSAERDYFRAKGVGEVVVGETELALEMARHALRRFGVSSAEAQAVIQRLRDRSESEV